MADEPEIVVEEPAKQTAAAPEVNKGQAIKAFVFSILGASFGSSCYLSLLGLIFSIISKGMNKSAPECGFKKAAGIINTIGLIISILGMIGFVIYIIVVAIGAMAGAMDGIFADLASGSF